MLNMKPGMQVLGNKGVLYLNKRQLETNQGSVHLIQV